MVRQGETSGFEVEVELADRAAYKHSALYCVIDSVVDVVDVVKQDGYISQTSLEFQGLSFALNRLHDELLEQRGGVTSV